MKQLFVASQRVDFFMKSFYFLFELFVFMMVLGNFVLFQSIFDRAMLFFLSYLFFKENNTALKLFVSIIRFIQFHFDVEILVE